MKRNMNRGIAISKCFSRALYCDLGELIGVCVEGHAHLAQTASDLDGIEMRMRGQHIEIIIFSVLRRVHVFWCLWRQERCCAVGAGEACCVCVRLYWRDFENGALGTG